MTNRTAALALVTNALHAGSSSFTQIRTVRGRLTFEVLRSRSTPRDLIDLETLVRAHRLTLVSHGDRRYSVAA